METRWPGLALQRGASFLLLFLFGNEEVKVRERDGPQELCPSTLLPTALYIMQ